MSSYDRLYTTCTSSLPTEPLLRALALCSSNAADLCYGIDCGEHGSCVAPPPSAGLPPSCQCEAGYSGASCAVADPCADVDCGGHGLCVDGTCECEAWYSGAACAVVDPCMGVDCGGHGTCGGGTCACQDGYTGTHCDSAPGPPCCSHICSQDDDPSAYGCGAQFSCACCNACVNLAGCSVNQGQLWCDRNQPDWDASCDRHC